MKRKAEAAWELAMKVQEVILRATPNRSRDGKQQRSSALAIGNCGAGNVAMRNKDVASRSALEKSSQKAA